MKKKATPLYIPVTLFAAAGLWTAVLLLDISHGTASVRMIVMYLLCALSSLAAAIVHLNKYKKTRASDTQSDN